METSVLDGVAPMKALKLEVGGIYVIECDYRMDKESMERFKADLDREGRRLGVTFLGLGKGFTIARESKSAEPEL